MTSRDVGVLTDPSSACVPGTHRTRPKRTVASQWMIISSEMVGFARVVLTAGICGGLVLSSARSQAAMVAPSEDAKVGNRVAIMHTRYEGPLNEASKTAFDEQLTRGLVQGGLDVISPRELVELSGVAQCDNDKCIALVAGAAEARWVVSARMTVVDKNYEVRIDAHDGADGSLVGTSSESCELCGTAEVEELVLKQAAGLRSKLESLALGPAIYRFTSEPSGAQVTIDGKPVGTTPLDHEIAPGEHRAEVTLPGFLPQQRTITAIKGVREALAFELDPQPLLGSTLDSHERRRAIWPVGWGLFGVGLASSAAGVTFLVLHQRPYQAQCSGDDVDPLGNCRQRYRTLVHGAAFTAVGGAALAAAIGMIVAGRKKKKTKGKSPKDTGRTTRVTLQPTGVVIGGRF
jgi:hypothetical protein